MRCGSVRKKLPNSKVSEFSILPYTQNQNLEISESFILAKVLVVYETQNRKNDLKEETLTLRCGLGRKNVNFRGF